MPAKATPAEPGDQPVINLRGEKVALGPFTRQLLPVFERWFNDFAVAIFSGDPLIPMRKELVEADYERNSKDWPRERVEFVIYERASLRPIGLTELRHLDRANGTADFGIMIGEKDCWGKGFGTEATILLLDYGFTVLGLHNVLLTTAAYNTRAQRAYTRAGFREIGRRREVFRLGGRRYDDVFMECLATEFTSPIARVVELPD
jgi:RimJ/RimL family protein N-acetyltransferase